MGSTLPSLKCRLLMRWISPILFRICARRGIFLAASAIIVATASGANGQPGFRDEITAVPGGFVFVGSLDPQGIPLDDTGHSGSAARFGAIDANGVSRLSSVTDFDELHEFNIGFDNVRYNENFGAGAVQVLNIIWLGDSRPIVTGKKIGRNSPQRAESARAARDDTGVPDAEERSAEEPEDSNSFGVAYGIGTLGTEQQLHIRAYGSVIGDSYWASNVENHVLGPKAGLVWRNRRGPWSFDLQSSILFGFNSGQVDQSSRVGADNVPGALNRLLYMKATYSSQSDDRQIFTPVGELRAQSRFRLTDALSLRTTWSSLVVGNLLNETGEIHWALPDTTIIVENDNLFIHQLYCGLEYIH